MIELKFDNTNRNFDSFVNSTYDTEAALYLRIDVANACAEITKNLKYSQKDTQKRMMLQTAIAIMEMVEHYPEGDADGR